MKIYFVASISGKKTYLKEYQEIISVLKAEGHTVTESTLEPTVDYVYGLSDQDKSSFYKKMLGFIQGADLIVAEVSHPSLGVGHEVSVALEKGKPVIALHTGSGAPHLLEGMESERLVLAEYTLPTVKNVLLDAIEFAKDQSDTRFNFFIAPKHSNYLDWIAKTRRIPRSAYLRTLIKKDMENEPDYPG